MVSMNNVSHANVQLQAKQAPNHAHAMSQPLTNNVAAHSASVSLNIANVHAEHLGNKLNKHA
ncbi:MAG: hypothetical protein WCK67_12975 [bacterium]